MALSVLDYKALSNDYARHHTHRMNRLCHALGIPMIVFCVVRWTQFGASRFPWAAAALPLYVLWDFNLALIAAAIILAMSLAATAVGSWTVVAVFVAGWILQFLGHSVFEKKNPAFSKNIIHLLVGPIWILGEFLGP
jgi:uncharacterized membrane protein YGL010W